MEGLTDMNQFKQFTLRFGNKNDAEQLMALVHSIAKDYGFNLNFDTDPDLQDVEYHYIKNGGEFVIAVDESVEIAGCCGLQRINSEEIELRKLFVSKKYRGLGLGRFLMERALNHAQKLGYKCITAETVTWMKEAVGLYRAYGFSECPPTRHSRADIRFSKNL